MVISTPSLFFLFFFLSFVNVKNLGSVFLVLHFPRVNGRVTLKENLKYGSHEIAKEERITDFFYFIKNVPRTSKIQISKQNEKKIAEFCFTET